MDYAQLCVLAVVVSTMSVVISRSKLFDPVRGVIWRNSPFFGELVRCTFCVSFWIAAVVVAYYQPTTIQSRYVLVDLTMSWLFTAWVSSVLSAVLVWLYLVIGDDR